MIGCKNSHRHKYIYNCDAKANSVKHGFLLISVCGSRNANLKDCKEVCDNGGKVHVPPLSAHIIRGRVGGQRSSCHCIELECNRCTVVWTCPAFLLSFWTLVECIPDEDHEYWYIDNGPNTPEDYVAAGPSHQDSLYFLGLDCFVKGVDPR
jgi:hypothetical protein